MTPICSTTADSTRGASKPIRTPFRSDQAFLHLLLPIQGTPPMTCHLALLLVSGNQQRRREAVLRPWSCHAGLRVRIRLPPAERWYGVGGETSYQGVKR